MTNNIHPTAIVSPDVEIGDNNFVGPFCVIGGMGAPVQIGSNNYFGAFVMIGSPAQSVSEYSNAVMLDFKTWTFDHQDKTTGVIIGDRNVVRDRVSIDSGISKPTIIENNCYLHSLSQINHDCILGENVIFAPAVIAAGSSTFLHSCQVGANAVIHQGLEVGSYAMIGMNSTVTKNVPNFALCFGSPSVVRGVNRRGLQRRGISDEDIEITNTHLMTGDYAIPDSVKSLL